MWELGYKESWAPKNWCFWTVVLEKTPESPLDCKDIKPVNPKGNQSSIFIGRTDAEAETPVLWPTDVKNWLIRKDPDSGKDWRWENGMTEDEMVGWHHRLDGHEFEWTLGVGDGQGGLAYCDSWGCTESDTTEQLNWTDSACEILIPSAGLEPGIWQWKPRILTTRQPGNPIKQGVLNLWFMDPLNIQEYVYFMGKSPQFSHCQSGLRRKNDHSKLCLPLLSLTLSLPLRILSPALLWLLLPDPCLSHFSSHVLRC